MTLSLRDADYCTFHTNSRDLQSACDTNPISSDPDLSLTQRSQQASAAADEKTNGAKEIALNVVFTEENGAGSVSAVQIDILGKGGRGEKEERG